MVLCALKCLRSLKVHSFLKTDTLRLLLEELETGILFQSCFRCLVVGSENAPAYAGLVPAVDLSSLQPLCLLDLEHYKFYFGIFMYKAAMSGKSRAGIIQDISLPLLLVGK